MATDATGAPTSLGIPKFNTSADAPSGLGSNAQMDAIDTLLAARVVKPAGIVSGETPVWNGSGWDRSSVTRVGTGSLSGYPWANADIAAAAAIAISKLAGYPTDGTKVLKGDGTWGVPSGAIAPTFISTVGADQASAALGTNVAFLSPLPNIVTPTIISRITFRVTVQSGNMDVGIYYSDDESTFTRLFNQGSFAVPAVGMQTKTLSAAQTITPVAGRRWYLAISVDNASAGISNAGASVVLGISKAASFPLPASIATATTGVIAPVMYGQV